MAGSACAAEITKNNKTKRILGVFLPSGKDALVRLPRGTSLQSCFSLFFCLTSSFLSSSPPLRFLFTWLPLCSPLCQVVILISLSPVVYFLLYRSNYLSVLSSPCTPSSVYLPLCKISPSALTFIRSHSLPSLISPASPLHLSPSFFQIRLSFPLSSAASFCRPSCRHLPVPPSGHGSD